MLQKGYKMRRRSFRNGLSIFEVALSIVIVSVVSIGIIKQIKSATRTNQIQVEMDYKIMLENAMKMSFEQIIDMYEPVCSKITSDAQTKWGWGHNQCSGTSPFPIYVNPEKIRYNINLNSLSASNKQSLINNIESAYSPYCSVQSTTNTQINMLCPNLSGIVYNLGSGNVASAHTAGQDINPFNVPTATISVQRREGTGLFSTQTYKVSFMDVYEKRRNFSLEKFNVLRSSMKSFYDNQLAVEVANAPSTGLNSTDDEFIPWQWKMFGDKTSQVIGSVCNTAGGTTCSNLNTNNIWRSTVSGAGLYSRRLYNNLLSGDSRMAVDGFGNQIYIYPMMSQCANSDMSACNTVAPAVPQKNYFNILRPPYMSAIYISTYKNKTTVAPPYGRAYVSY